MSTTDVATFPTFSVGASDVAAELEKKIRMHTAHVGVIGLGYVGLPLALTFVRPGFAVTGFDVDPRRVSALSEGRSYISDIPDAEVAGAVERRQLMATTDFDRLADVDAISICVPTPLRK